MGLAMLKCPACEDARISDEPCMHLSIGGNNLMWSATTFHLHVPTQHL